MLKKQKTKTEDKPPSPWLQPIPLLDKDFDNIKETEGTLAAKVRKHIPRSGE